MAWPAGTITAMHWSSDSQLLAVVLSEPAAGRGDTATPEGSSAESSSVAELLQDVDNATRSGQVSASAPATAPHVKIWHRSNWHWYMKADLSTDSFIDARSATGLETVVRTPSYSSLLHQLAQGVSSFGHQM